MMLVYVAHSGKTLELQAVGATKIQLVQQALAPRTDIPTGDQILMYNGMALDPGKPLSAYGLPVEGSSKGDVYLYNKSYFHPASHLPPPETLRSFSIHVAGPPAVPYERHLLDSSTSPLIRALPEYERQFRHHLARGQAVLEASQARHRACLQLVGEVEVQGRAIDAARTNVEKHYRYIFDSYDAFMQKYSVQHTRQQDILTRFPADLDALRAVTILPPARTTEMRTLLDLIPEQRMRDWARHCEASHRSLGSKVGEGEGLWAALKADVEALLLQAPTISMESLVHALQTHQAALSEQASIVQVLQADLAQIERLIKGAMDELQGRMHPGSAGTPLDKCQLMEAMHDNHLAQLLPRVDACEAGLSAFCQRCIDAKNQMAREGVGQLRRISGQQSKIRMLRNILAAHVEAVSQLEAAFAELVLVTRVAPTYRQCLAECMRREAFAEIYAGRASQMAEHMGRLRRKEAAKREGFKKNVVHLIPQQLLTRLGLEVQPPHCQIHLPNTPSQLPHVTAEDLKRVPLPAEASSAFGPTAQAGKDSDADTSRTATAATLQKQQDQDEEAEEGPEESGSRGVSLEMENAQLRAELAALVAQEAARAAAAPAHDPAPSGSAATTPTARDAAARTAAVKFREALAAQEDLVRRQQQQLASSRLLAASYEGRIRGLETRLASTSLVQPLDAPQAPTAGGSGAEAIGAANQQSSPPREGDGAGAASPATSPRAAISPQADATPAASSAPSGPSPRAGVPAADSDPALAQPSQQTSTDTRSTDSPADVRGPSDPVGLPAQASTDTPASARAGT